jgi:chemotaxis protein CheX
MQMPPQNSAPDAQNPFPKEVLANMVHQAIDSVFTTMLKCKAAPAEPKADGPKSCPLTYFDPEKRVIVGMVGFLGSVSGAVYVYLEETLARKLVAALLGMTPEEIAKEGIDTINDGLGELCNMTVGSFKQQLCATGYDCRLTIPSIISGSHFSIETSADVIRRSFPYQTEDKLFVLDILLKAENN